MPNLVRLDLEGCTKLVEIHPSIGVLKKLCFFHFERLCCSKVFNSPRQVKVDIVRWIAWPFQFLYPRAHNDSVISCSSPSLPSFFHLRDLDLSFCNLPQLPDAIGSLYIFNCPKLGERERCTSMSYSWMKRLIQAHQESSAPYREIHVVIPGVEIPKWFNNQSQSVGVSDGEITLDLSSVMHDDNWIGMACCVVFEAQPLGGPTSSRNEWESKVCISYTDNRNGSWIYIPVILDGNLIIVESNHIWLTYIDWKCFFRSVDDLNDTTLRPEYGTNLKMKVVVNSAPSLRVEVKSFGCRWLFEQDLELFDLSLLQSTTRKRKFLEIQDSAQA
ncbi:Leucine-rich repeat domain superfamily [Sesbania bispinosa]|nr:Leucine-rich repeat domain superfamily [Sesbania bispinosa]